MWVGKGRRGEERRNVGVWVGKGRRGEERRGEERRGEERCVCGGKGRGLCVQVLLVTYDTWS